MGWGAWGTWAGTVYEHHCGPTTLKSRSLSVPTLVGCPTAPTRLCMPVQAKPVHQKPVHVDALHSLYYSCPLPNVHSVVVLNTCCCMFAECARGVIYGKISLYSVAPAHKAVAKDVLTPMVACPGGVSQSAQCSAMYSQATGGGLYYAHTVRCKINFTDTMLLASHSDVQR